MDKEFQRLKEKYKLKGLKLYYDAKLLDRLKIGAQFNFIFNEIVLRDRRLCKVRLLQLLHEIGHAIQYKHKRLVVNRRDTRKMYELEVEAEKFALREYEKLYARKFGSCKNDPWTLDTYEGYKKYFKKHLTGAGYGLRR